jgi:hypothetical protein
MPSIDCLLAGLRIERLLLKRLLIERFSFTIVPSLAHRPPILRTVVALENRLQ